MDRRRLKFILLFTGVAATMVFLLFVGVGSGGVYYYTVDEFLTQHPDAAGRFRVNGKVVPGSIERLPTGMDVRFTMIGGASSVPVRYHGVVPDTFVDDADVVVEGRLAPDGHFDATILLAKCPSKYETADGAKTEAMAR